MTARPPDYLLPGEDPDAWDEASADEMDDALCDGEYDEEIEL